MRAAPMHTSVGSKGAEQGEGRGRLGRGNSIEVRGKAGDCIGSSHPFRLASMAPADQTLLAVALTGTVPRHTDRVTCMRRGCIAPEPGGGQLLRCPPLGCSPPHPALRHSHHLPACLPACLPLPPCCPALPSSSRQPLFPGESGVDQLVEIIKVLGTPTREEIKCMNPDYTEFKFPQIKAHPWHKARRGGVDAVHGQGRDGKGRAWQSRVVLVCGPHVAWDVVASPWCIFLPAESAFCSAGRWTGLVGPLRRIVDERFLCPPSLVDWRHALTLDAVIPALCFRSPLCPWPTPRPLSFRTLCTGPDFRRCTPLLPLPPPPRPSSCLPPSVPSVLGALRAGVPQAHAGGGGGLGVTAAAILPQPALLRGTRTASTTPLL